MFDDTMIQDNIQAILSGWLAPEDSDLNPENTRITTYEHEGMLTLSKGLVIRLADGSEFQLTIVQSR